jgi:hypothetical protein
MTRDEAIAATARILASASAERDQLAAAEGPAAVAQAAWFPGHPLTAPEIEAQYSAMQTSARRARAA